MLIADDREHWKIKDADIDDSFERAPHQIRKLNFRSLPIHHHVIYATVHGLSECTSQEFRSQYDEAVDAVYHGTDLQPMGNPDRRNKLKELNAYNLIKCGGQTHRVYHTSIAAALTFLAENRNQGWGAVELYIGRESPCISQVAEIVTRDDTDGEVEPVEQVISGGTRVDGPQWRLNLNRTQNYEIMSAQNASSKSSYVELKPPQITSDTLVLKPQERVSKHSPSALIS